MTNIKSLIKKIELFEKLALFGNRKDYLKTISQDLSTFNDIKKYLSLAKDTVRSGNFTELGSRWMDWFNSIKPELFKDPNTLEEAEKQYGLLEAIKSGAHYQAGDYKGDNYLSRVSLNLNRYLKMVLDGLKEIKGFEESLVDRTEFSSGSGDVGSEKWTNNNDSTTKIDPKVQASLNELFQLKLKSDGVLGPQTAQALQLFKNKYNNTKNIFDPKLHQDVINTANDKKSGLIRQVPF